MPILNGVREAITGLDEAKRKEVVATAALAKLASLVVGVGFLVLACTTFPSPLGIVVSSLGCIAAHDFGRIFHNTQILFENPIQQRFQLGLLFEMEDLVKHLTRNTFVAQQLLPLIPKE